MAPSALASQSSTAMQLAVGWLALFNCSLTPPIEANILIVVPERGSALQIAATNLGEESDGGPDD